MKKKLIESQHTDKTPSKDMVLSGQIGSCISEAKRRGRIEEDENEVRFFGKWEMVVVNKTSETIYGDVVYKAQLFLCDEKNFN